MSYKDVLIFDISSEYGHFRKYNTTTSPLTYSIPTRGAVVGLLGAILGIERELGVGKYKEEQTPLVEIFSKQKAGIAIQILSPIKKVFMGFNLINTKDSFFNIKNRTQIEFELVKDPFYRIYLSLDDAGIFEELSERIKNKRHHFTPYLGLSQFTANVEYIDQSKASGLKNENEYREIATAVNLSYLPNNDALQFNSAFYYSANMMPIDMDRERKVLEYSEVLIEKEGKSIQLKNVEYFEVENHGNILFL